jgi:hypothetical protein
VPLRQASDSRRLQNTTGGLAIRATEGDRTVITRPRRAESAAPPTNRARSRNVVRASTYVFDPAEAPSVFVRLADRLLPSVGTLGALSFSA